MVSSNCSKVPKTLITLPSITLGILEPMLKILNEPMLWSLSACLFLTALIWSPRLWTCLADTLPLKGSPTLNKHRSKLVFSLTRSCPRCHAWWHWSLSCPAARPPSRHLHSPQPAAADHHSYSTHWSVEQKAKAEGWATSATSLSP